MAENPELLVAQVFKLRYCREGELPKATAKKDCSFVWRSIIWSKGVLDLGVRWKVGNGVNIRVFGDRWVEGCQIDKLQGVVGQVDEQMRVAQLLNEDGGWDAGLVGSLFNKFETEAILQTTIKEKTEVDRRWWNFEATGRFSVKTCYLAQMRFYAQHNHMSSEDRKMWRRLVWQVSIPPKVKVFVWRACWNVIPTMGNLRKHHVPVDGTCPLYRDRWATTEHMLLFCPKIRGIWKTTEFWRVLKGEKTANFIDIAACMEEEVEADEYAIWCMMVWKV